MSDDGARDQEFTRLLTVLRELRQRCPWDREQTIASLGKHLVEEAYEALDAIERDDTGAIIDELGDLHFTGARGRRNRRGAAALSRRAIASVGGRQTRPASSARLWRRDRRDLRGGHRELEPNQAGRARELGRDVGARWRRAGDAGARRVRRNSVHARVRPGWTGTTFTTCSPRCARRWTRSKARSPTTIPTRAASELGDMLLALANAPRFIDHSAEETLRRACDKFTHRFKLVERLAAGRGLDLKQLRPLEIDALWNEAKRESTTK